MTVSSHESAKGLTHESTMMIPGGEPRNGEYLANKYEAMAKTDKRVSQTTSDCSL